MIDSLLVANRGEIACRIFRTARRMGIRTIAVYSEADASGRHVREADSAVCIGGAAPRDSYLNIARIIDAAKTAGAVAIHPGYGFLSENAQFAQSCEGAGLVFVGPPAAAMAAMGSKTVAKARMRKAGVPVLPGYDGAEQELSDLERAARKLPLPLMIKPAAGGGGKGMRIVRQQAEIGEALSSARRLAQSAFGDGTLLIERFLEAPRHVEVQVFADSRGQCVHLGDRDCSVQRRHQKLLEEAPAPGIPDPVRERMRAAAVLVAREIGYVGAGTIEFLFDGGEFYFLEMNTRLQVEHTVTEAITGLDLVEWQIRVAGGEGLPLAQDQISLRGHAMEARVCAEDPERDFLPSAGHLRLLEWPHGESIRVDEGFESGDEVPATYDSLLGKVIAWAPSREHAAATLAGALDRTYCAGVRTNERWLARILRNDRFLAAQHSVAFLHTFGAELAGPGQADFRSQVLGALIAHRWIAGVSAAAPATAHATASALVPAAAAPATPWDARDGFSPNLPATVDFALTWGEKLYPVKLTFERGVPYSAQVAAQEVPLADLSFLPDAVSVRMGAVLVKARYWVDDHRVHVWLGPNHDDFTLEDARDREYSTSAASGGLTTPLPGVVVAVAVKVGQIVSAGELLMVVEAMKMEHSIVAPSAGTIRAIYSAPGDRVPENQALLDLDVTASQKK